MFTRRSGSRHRADATVSDPDGTPDTTADDARAIEWPSVTTGEALETKKACCEGDLAEDSAVESEQLTAASDTPRPCLRLLVFLALPLLALAITAGAGYLKWQATSLNAAQTGAMDSIRAASDTTVKMLSYRADTAERDLGGALDLVTGNLRNDYTSLTKDVVIPNAKQKQISSVATVPAAAAVSTTSYRAVVLVFVNQTVIIGSEPPANSTSSVKVTLEKQDGRWLVSSFDPI